MRLRRVAWTTFRVPFARPYETAHGTLEAREGLLLRVEDEDGFTGLGEWSPFPGLAAEPLAAGLSAMPRLAAALLAGAHPSPSFAIDTALADLAARRRGLPLAACLAPDRARRSVPVNATVAVADARQAAEAAARAVAQGFACVKLKVGLPGDEVARIQAVRAAIGPATRLRLDANGAWSAATAIQVLRAIGPVDLVEQPTPDVEGLRRVRVATGVRVAADESVRSAEDARRVLDAEAADVLVLKPMLVGFDQTRALADLAPSIVTTTVDAGVGVAVALHLAATLPEPLEPCGLATGPLLVADLLQRPLGVADGAMAVPDGPGLGIDLDEAVLARYAAPWREVCA